MELRVHVTGHDDHRLPRRIADTSKADVGLAGTCLKYEIRDLAQHTSYTWRYIRGASQGLDT